MRTAVQVSETTSRVAKLSEPSSTRSAPAEQGGDIGAGQPLVPAPRSATSGLSRATASPATSVLAPPDIGGAEQDLALQIVERHAIVVDHPERADARRGEILDGRRADPARADDRDGRGEQLALPLAANLLEDDMAGVAVELGVAEAHRPVEPKPPTPRAVSSSSSTSAKPARSTGAGTSWAIRSPRRDLERLVRRD